MHRPIGPRGGKNSGRCVSVIRVGRSTERERERKKSDRHPIVVMTTMVMVERFVTGRRSGSKQAPEPERNPGVSETPGIRLRVLSLLVSFLTPPPPLRDPSGCRRRRRRGGFGFHHDPGDDSLPRMIRPTASIERPRHRLSVDDDRC